MNQNPTFAGHVYVHTGWQALSKLPDQF